MKKYGLTLLLCLLSFQAFAFSRQELIALLQKPENVQGRFVQQRFLKSLNKPITTDGQFVLIGKKGLLWQMQKPFANQLRVNADGIMQWDGNRWVANANMGQTQQVGLFLGLLSGDISALENQFDLQLNGSEQDWTLQLEPTGLLMRQIFSRIQLRGGATVQEIDLHETQGDRTLIRFSQIQINQPPDPFARSALD